MTPKTNPDELNKFEDRSNERTYFNMIPRLVWAYCKSPYEFTLWAVIHDIAGEML